MNRRSALGDGVVTDDEEFDHEEISAMGDRRIFLMAPAHQRCGDAANGLEPLLADCRIGMRIGDEEATDDSETESNSNTDG